MLTRQRYCRCFDGYFLNPVAHLYRQISCERTSYGQSSHTWIYESLFDPLFLQELFFKQLYARGPT